jgi:hypothetical protein
MAKYLDADAVLERLKEIGITDSIQTVRRWLREGQLKGELPEGELRKGKKKSAGYRIDPKDLEEFIQKKREENWLYPEVKRLQQENQQLKAEIDRLKQKISNQKDGSDDEPASEEGESQQGSPTKGPDELPRKQNTLSPVELNIFWRQVTRAKQPPEVETYLRMESVQRNFFNTILSNNTVQGDRFICPITGRDFTDRKQMMACVLSTIIEEKRKAHLQWVRENDPNKKDPAKGA